MSLISSSSSAGARNAFSSIQTALRRAQTEMASGRLDDAQRQLGARAGQAIASRNDLATNAAFRAANDALAARASAADLALGALGGVADEARNAALAALNGGGADGLATLARGAATQTRAALNARVAGVYVFGGQNAGAPPLQSAIDAGAGKAAIDAAFTQAFGVAPGASGANAITPSAMSAFLDGPFAQLFSGANWTTIWSQASDAPMKATLGDGQTVAVSANANAAGPRALTQGLAMLGALGLDALSGETRALVLNKSAATLGAAGDALRAMQVNVGFVQRDATSATQSLQARTAIAQKNIDALEGVDPAEAATRVSQLSTQLETAYSLTARIAKLTLASFI